VSLPEFVDFHITNATHAEQVETFSQEGLKMVL
jgi:hypothetical protein